MSECEKKFELMKPRGGMREWLLAQQEAGFISVNEVKRLLELNEGKYDRLNAYGLPNFATTGACKSLAEALARVPTDKWDTSKFLARCVPKDVSSQEFHLERVKDIAFDDIPAFVEQLPGGQEQYQVEIREYWKSDYSGSIIADGAGRVKVEQKPGDHAEFENAENKTIKDAIYDINASSAAHFEYAPDTKSEEKEIIINALKYFLPQINRAELEKLKVYAEYCYSKQHGFKFLEVNNDNYWTQLKTQPTERDMTGD